MQRQYKYLVLLVAVMLLLAGCTLFSPKHGSVNVKLALKDGSPISAVEVTLIQNKKNWKVKTNADGIAKFILASGDYVATANVKLLDGTTHTISQNVVVESGKVTDVIVADDSLGRVVINVKHARSGNPIDQCDIKIVHGDKTYDVVTDDKGSYAFYAKAGTYKVQASNVGIVTDFIDVQVTNKTTITNIEMDINEFQGSIAFADGTAIAGAKVKVGEIERETDKDGKFVMFVGTNKDTVSIELMGQTITVADVDLLKPFDYKIEGFGLYEIKIVDKADKPLPVKEMKIDGKELTKLANGSFQGLIEVGEKTPIATLGTAHVKELGAINIEAKKDTITVKVDSVQLFTTFADFGDNLYKTGSWDEQDGTFIATAASECRFISNIMATGHYAYSVDVLFGARYSPSIAHQKPNAYYDGAVTVDSKIGKFAIRSHTTVGVLKENQTDAEVPQEDWVNILMVMNEDNSVEVTITNLDTGEVLLDKAVLPAEDNLYRDGYLGLRGFNNTKFKNVFVDMMQSPVL